jgi:formylmethanofuran dehydrogenase subunit D
MARLKITLLTGRSIDQGVGKELGKLTKEYENSVAVCELDPEDIKVLNLKEKENVRVLTESGSVVLRAAESKRAPHRGVVYVPYGPWANVVIGAETSGTGMPSFKGVPAEVEPARDEAVPRIHELLRSLYGK